MWTEFSLIIVSRNIAFVQLVTAYNSFEVNTSKPDNVQERTTMCLSLQFYPIGFLRALLLLGYSPDNWTHNEILMRGPAVMFLSAEQYNVHLTCTYAGVQFPLTAFQEVSSGSIRTISLCSLGLTIEADVGCVGSPAGQHVYSSPGLMWFWTLLRNVIHSELGVICLIIYMSSLTNSSKVLGVSSGFSAWSPVKSACRNAYWVKFIYNYINDLPDIFSHRQIAIYADDTEMCKKVKKVSFGYIVSRLTLMLSGPWLTFDK